MISSMIWIHALPSNSLFWVRRASRTSVLSGCLVSKTPVDISILMGLSWVSLYLITSSAGAEAGLEWDCVREAPLPSAGRSVRTTMARQHYWASLSLSQLRICRRWLELTTSPPAIGRGHGVPPLALFIGWWLPLYVWGKAQIYHWSHLSNNYCVTYYVSGFSFTYWSLSEFSPDRDLVILTSIRFRTLGKGGGRY